MSGARLCSAGSAMGRLNVLVLPQRYAARAARSIHLHSCDRMVEQIVRY